MHSWILQTAWPNLSNETGTSYFRLIDALLAYNFSISRQHKIPKKRRRNKNTAATEVHIQHESRHALDMFMLTDTGNYKFEVIG
jgi:hypothetical protein